MKFQDKEFQKLKLEWYKKLKDEGFDDIESAENANPKFEYTVMSPESAKHKRTFKDGTPEEREEHFKSSQEYYSMASGFLHEYDFKDEIEKEIWQLHSDGVGYRDIAEALKSKRPTINKDSVNKTVKTLKNIMIKGLHT